MAASSLSLSSLEMLSKKELLSYMDPLGITTSSFSLDRASTVGAVEASPSGDPEAIASLIRSCLLNFAFEDAKSKSVVGTSIFGCCG